MANTKGKGNFAADPERAREAGRKGGQSRGKNSAAAGRSTSKERTEG